MDKQRAQYLLSLAIVLVILTLAWGWYITSQPHRREIPPVESSDRTTTERSLPENTAVMLEELRWHDVDAVLPLLQSNAALLDEILTYPDQASQPPVKYLQAMALLVRGQPELAAKAFDRLDPIEIPARYLYPAYRLSQALHPLAANRYLPFLQKAMLGGELSPLIAARVHASEGNLPEALYSYLKTDPGKWVGFDVLCIKQISRHTGVSSEIRRMILAALHSGRIAPNIRQPLEELLRGTADSAEMATLKGNLQSQLMISSKASKTASASLAQMLAARAVFMKRDYLGLQQMYRDSKPMMLPNETVLLLFLAGVQLRDTLAMDRWGQEIKRRSPTREVGEWVLELRSSVR